MRPLLLAFIVMMLSCKNPSQTLDIVNSRTHRIKLVQVTYPGGDHYSPTTGQLTNIATFDGVWAYPRVRWFPAQRRHLERPRFRRIVVCYGGSREGGD